MSTQADPQPLTPALYRTRITQLRRSPVHHYGERSSYSWYVDVDQLPSLPWWLRPFARFEAVDHFTGSDNDTLRQRVDGYLAEHGIYLPGGRITALLMPRVLGRTFNPLSLFWCHDATGELRCVIAEVHNTYGERHAYLLPPDQDTPAMVAKTFYTSPFNGVDGYYLVRAPRPAEQLDLTVSLHRENEPALVATVRGTRRRASAGQVLRLQFSAPLAPQMAALSARVQNLILRLRGVPVVPRPATHEHLPQAVSMHSATAGWSATQRSWMPS
ncbi:hypothetical protein MANY_29630 [Mycolicibacterium anyangense]|uniref:DUF1365 domain-containing protein n=1 Tax=Mycolicibacterium anyangense TaxID=1431246 RepID=A0A6N4W6N4_9MYCO|nr:DUF1365 family protein [Mycolicibacterium anyangense]BBZ77626.1 hypothetical protein MANY_29630 [Mycolicibacterium anyangense]